MKGTSGSTVDGVAQRRSPRATTRSVPPFQNAAAQARRSSPAPTEPNSLEGELGPSHPGSPDENTPPFRTKPPTIDVRSLLFDPTWYLAQNADVAAARLDPVQHYLDNGSTEGRDPNPFFSTSFYCENNADVAASGMNPFLHYVLYGAREGRAPRE